MATNQLNKVTAEAQYDWNLETNELFSGEGWQTLFGYTPLEMAKLDDWEIRLHPEDARQVGEKFRSLIYQSLSNDFAIRYRFMKADGNYAHVLDKGIVIRDKKGKGLHVFGTMLDETEYHQKARELEEQTSLRIETVEKALKEIGKHLNDEVIQNLAAAKLLLEAGLQSPDVLESFSTKSLDSINLAIKEIRRLNKRYLWLLEQNL